MLTVAWPDSVRLIKRNFQRWCILLLATLVLAGGMYPALYESILPHTHLFIGGPPPPHWQDHEHPNPLTALLGSPVAVSASAVRWSHTASENPFAVDRFLPDLPNNTLANGRVVSVYQGLNILVVSLLALDILVPSFTGKVGLFCLGRLALLPGIMPGSLDHRPEFPPPRFLPSAIVII